MRIGKIKSKHVLKELRFSGGYFLNEDAVNSRLLEENAEKCKPLKELANVFNPPIFKRQFCENTERAVPYCQSSDVTNALEGSDVYINKVQAKKVGSVVKDKQILVTGFGTIGNTRLVNELSDGIAYANNVCRIEVNDKSNYGYIYALMTSKYGRSQLNKNASGSVVRYIEAPGIKETLVPKLPEPKQEQIHKLIVEASKLRVEANKLFRESVELLEENLPLIKDQNIYVAKIKSRIEHNSRLEANYNTSLIDSFYQNLEELNVQIKTIDELSESVFTPPIFKRVRTNNPANGVPFLSGSDLLNQYPKFNNYLSKGMKNLDKYILKEGMIAIQDAGTIGYVSFITEFLDGVSATNNLVRIIPKERDNHNYYIYCFLKTSIGQKLLKSLEFGSVQKHIDNYQISDFRVPIYRDLFEKISHKVKTSIDNLSMGCYLEQKAINLIENEIEQWQES